MSEQTEIYIVDVESYNNGIPRGLWFDTKLGSMSISIMVDELLEKRNSLEGSEIRATKGFGTYIVSRNEDLNRVCKLAEFIHEAPEYGSELLIYHYDIDAARKAHTDHYVGCYESAEQYVERYITKTFDVPPGMRKYIHYKEIVKDMYESGELFTISDNQDNVFVFHNNWKSIETSQAGNSEKSNEIYHDT